MLAALALSLLAGPTAAEAVSMTDVPAPVAKILRANGISLDDVSLYVHEVTAPQPVLAINAQVPRNPASTIKLLTSRAGLDILGPSFTWKTEAYLRGSIADGRLDGDMIIKGYGDPNLSPGDLWRLLWGVRERGVATISGDIVLDQSYFAPIEGGRGDFDGAAESTYNALPAALSVNAQATDIHLVRQGGNDGVHVFTDPPLANLLVENALKVVDAPCQGKYHRPTIRVAEDGPLATLSLSGTFAAACGEARYPRLMMDPAVHTAGAVAALWRAMGGRIEGVIRTGERPSDARRVHTVTSVPLVQAIRSVNKDSNNLVSRTLFLTLGAVRAGAPGTLPKAREAVAGWLKGEGLDFPELFVENGAGLSREARISAESLGRLLGHAYASPVMPEYLSSLSIAGSDGTLRKRLRGTPMAGRAQMKTGTLKGVTALAGYVLDRDGRRWVVVSMMNNPRLPTWAGKAAEDALVGWVYREAAAIGTEPQGPRHAQALAPSWFLHPTSAPQ